MREGTYEGLRLRLHGHAVERGRLDNGAVARQRLRRGHDHVPEPRQDLGYHAIVPVCYFLGGG